jgi:hypothetical protein
MMGGRGGTEMMKIISDDEESESLGRAVPAFSLGHCQ